MTKPDNIDNMENLDLEIARLDCLASKTDRIIEKIETTYLNVLEKIEEEGIPQIEGRLDVLKNKNTYQYYHYRKNPITNKYERKYIKKKDIHIAQQLALRDYLLDVKKFAEKKLKEIREIKEEFIKLNIEMLYFKISYQKREIISPILKSKEEIVEDWKNQKYGKKEFKESNKVYITMKGEKVRSKSEKMLADLFYSKGILYKYEKPLILQDGSVVYPDFTILHPEKYIEIYWEHFGMMDDFNYIRSMIYKSDKYLKNEIYIGLNLITTYETSTKPINFEVVEKLIEEHILPKNK